MSPVSPDLRENALETTALSTGSLIRVNVEGWNQDVPPETIRAMFALTLGNITWVGRAPETEREFFIDRNAIGKLAIALPIHEWSHALLPYFLQAENIQAIYGIQNITIDTMPNEYSLEAHKKRYGDKWQSYYFNHDGFSFVDAFYNATITLSVDKTERTIRFDKFIADFKDHLMPQEQFRQKYLGGLYEAMYTFAALPVEAWNAIDKEHYEINIGKYVLSHGKSGNYFVREYDSLRDKHVDNNPSIPVHINRIGRRAIDAGHIV